MSWCSAASNKEIYVHNRVQSIRELARGCQIRHVSGNHNPADYLTKAIKAKKFVVDELWWKGPDWVKDPLQWQTDNIYTLTPQIIHVPIFSNVPNIPNFHKFEVNTRYGKVNGALHKDSPPHVWSLFTYVLTIKLFIGFNRLINKSKNNVTNFDAVISKEEFLQGEILAIKTMQRVEFQQELYLLKKGKRIKNGPYAQVKLYLDTNGIIRCHGRLGEPELADYNTPVLFPERHPLTILYISHLHRCFNCPGTNNTTKVVMRKIHSLKLRKVVQEVVKNCIACQRLLSGS